MQCWNCQKDVPESAKRCQFCEADLTDAPTEEEMDFMANLLDKMNPADVEAMMAEMAECETAEEFADRIFIGPCPKCESEKTGNCEKDPEIENVVVGRCMQCGYLWCSLCGKPLEKPTDECPCWDEAIDDDWLPPL